MGENGSAVYKVEGISKVYGDRFILNNISFDINEQEIFGIIGTSGSGKTTLLNSLVGFIKADRGDIRFRNVNVLDTKDTKAYASIYKHQKILKKIYGFAAQKPSFYPNLSVSENLKYFGALHKVPKNVLISNMDHLLTLVGLAQSGHAIANKLSGGMQRRLDIACSLIHNPKILLLDEPTADLDPVLAGKIWHMLRIINQHGTTIIIASHHLAELEQLCDRIAIIKDGNIAALGKPSDIKAKGTPLESVHVESSPGDYKAIIAKIKKASPGDVKNFTVSPRSLVIDTGNPNKVILNILKIMTKMDEKIINVEIVKPTLDKAFILMNKEED